MQKFFLILVFIIALGVFYGCTTVETPVQPITTATVEEAPAPAPFGGLETGMKVFAFKGQRLSTFVSHCKTMVTFVAQPGHVELCPGVSIYFTDHGDDQLSGFVMAPK